MCEDSNLLISVQCVSDSVCVCIILLSINFQGETGPKGDPGLQVSMV